jgi:hypothetical protein
MRLGLLPSSYSRILETFHSQQHHLICITGGAQNLKRNAFNITLRKFVELRKVNYGDSKMVRACFDKAVPNMSTDYHLKHPAAGIEYLVYPHPGKPLKAVLHSLSVEEKKYIAHQIIASLANYHRNGLLYGRVSTDCIHYKKQGRHVSLKAFEGALNLDKVCSMLKYSRHNKHFCRKIRGFFPHFGKAEESRILEILKTADDSNNVEQAKKVWGILQARELYCLGRLLFNLLCEADLQEEQDSFIWNNLSDYLRVRENSLDIYALMRLVDKGFNFMQADALIGMLNDDYNLRPDIEQVLTAFNSTSMSTVFKVNSKLKSESLEFWQKASGHAKDIRETFYSTYSRAGGRRPRGEELINWTALERVLTDMYYYRFNSVVKSSILRIIGRLCQNSSLGQSDYYLNKVCREKGIDLEDVLGHLSQFEKDLAQQGVNYQRCIFINDYVMFNNLYFS